MTERFEVVIEMPAEPEDVEHVRAAFSETRIPTEVRAGYVRLSAGDLPPITIVVAPVAAFLAAVAAAFAAGFASEAGKDAYRALKSLTLKALTRPSRKEPSRKRGEFEIQDRSNGFTLLLHGDEPEEALIELFELDVVEEFAGAGVVAWSAEKGWHPVGASSFRLAPGRRRGRRARPDWP